VWGLAEAQSLLEGDIVRILPNGTVHTLHEAGRTNATIYLTNRCNARCICCPQPHIPEDCFEPGEVTDFIRLMGTGVEVVGITGGEPTAARGLLVEALQACRTYLPDARIELLTNGILLADVNYVKALASMRHKELVFEIPLYSDVACEHDRVMGIEAYRHVVGAILNLVRHHQKIALRTVVQAQNYARLPQFAEFVSRNFPFVVHVAFMGLEVIHQARANLGTVWVDPLDYISELEDAVRVLHRAGVSVSIYNTPLCALPKSLWQFARKSISAWKRKYRDFCGVCLVREYCGGIFATSGEHQSRCLRPVGDRCDLTGLPLLGVAPCSVIVPRENCISTR
jgi:His-Xaa-Ser system radical SAM maturase HxsC